MVDRINCVLQLHRTGRWFAHDDDDVVEVLKKLSTDPYTHAKEIAGMLTDGSLSMEEFLNIIETHYNITPPMLHTTATGSEMTAALFGPAGVNECMRCRNLVHDGACCCADGPLLVQEWLTDMPYDMLNDLHDTVAHMAYWDDSPFSTMYPVFASLAEMQYTIQNKDEPPMRRKMELARFNTFMIMVQERVDMMDGNNAFPDP